LTLVLKAASGDGPKLTVDVRFTDGCVELPVTDADVAEPTPSTTAETVPLVIMNLTVGIVALAVPTAAEF